MFSQSQGQEQGEPGPGREVSTAGEWVAEWQEIDRRLREYARHRAALDAAEAFDLLRAEQLKVHLSYGFATLYEYMERVLGYMPHAARERMRVARSLGALPATTAALARGELTFSAVRELTRVATAETEAEWLTATQGKVANQIERMVAHHRTGDRPDDPVVPDVRPRVVRIELSPEVYALWRQARSVVADERGSEISDADFVETLCRGAIAPGTGEGGPAHQIAYQQCPDCRRTTQNGAGREIDVAPEVFERASCDAKRLGSLDAAVPERATTTVTPRLREQAFARDHHRCTVPGCRSARNLDIHHVIEQCRGGTHDLWNLTLLCSGHHAALHAGLLTLHGQAPYELAFRWVYRSPIPAGLAPEARRAMIEQRVREIFDEGLPPEQVLDVPADRIERPSWDVDLVAARRKWRRQRQAASKNGRSEAPSGAIFPS
ncbi:MAG TPA: HNH endonuclease signature motif containing protein [Kofleriaceae bacterium]